MEIRTSWKVFVRRTLAIGGDRASVEISDDKLCIPGNILLKLQRFRKWAVVMEVFLGNKRGG